MRPRPKIVLQPAIPALEPTQLVPNTFLKIPNMCPHTTDETSEMLVKGIEANAPELFLGMSKF
jgi:hypothetical protein